MAVFRNDAPSIGPLVASPEHESVAKQDLKLRLKAWLVCSQTPHTPNWAMTQRRPRARLRHIPFGTAANPLRQTVWRGTLWALKNSQYLGLFRTYRNATASSRRMNRELQAA